MRAMCFVRNAYLPAGAECEQECPHRPYANLTECHECSRPHCNAHTHTCRIFRMTSSYFLFMLWRNARLSVSTSRSAARSLHRSHGSSLHRSLGRTVGRISVPTRDVRRHFSRSHLRLISAYVHFTFYSAKLEAMPISDAQ